MKVDEAVLSRGGYKRFDEDRRLDEPGPVRRASLPPNSAAICRSSPEAYTASQSWDGRLRISCATTLHKPLTLGQPGELQKPQRRCMSACLRDLRLVSCNEHPASPSSSCLPVSHISKSLRSP